MDLRTARRRHYVYLSVPLRGHVDPVMPMLKALADGGNRVTFFGYDSMLSLADSAGARFERYESQATRFDHRALEHFGTIFSALMDFTDRNVDGIVRRLDALAPDCVIHDQFCPWAKFAAWRLGLPAVSVTITLIFEKGNAAIASPLISGLAALGEPNAIRARVQERLGAPKWGIVDALQNKEGLNLVVRMPELQRGEYPDYRFVGPCLPERAIFFNLPPEPLPDDGLPLAYVAMGTVYAMEAERMARAVASLADAGFSVLVSAGESAGAMADLSGRPRVLVRQRVNQVSVLSRASAFVTHGGMSSTQEAMYASVVPIFHPLQQEQRAIAEVATGMKAGYLWDGESELGPLALKAMSDEAAREAADGLGRTIRAEGGVKAALGLIDRYLEGEAGAVT